MTGWGPGVVCEIVYRGEYYTRNSVWILLVAGVLLSVLPATVLADPIMDEDISVDIIIDGGDSGDRHYTNGWLVAGSGVPSVIRAGYTGSVPLNISFVRFVSVEKDTYGDVTGEYAGGLPCETTFPASENRAGNASILVQINYTVDGTGYDYFRTVYQPIDHATPMHMQSIAFESEVSIGDGMDITMVMEDAYGNAVTSLYEDATGGTPEMVTFETTRYAGSGLSNATVSGAESVRVPVGADGPVNAGFMVGTDAGPKYLIHIVPPEAVDDRWLTITAIPDAEPYAMAVSVLPNTDETPYVPADGASKFYLTYTLSDRYGNPSGNQVVRFTDDVIGDVFTQRTNSNGQIMFTFGPFDTVATFTIHAEAVANASVAVDQQVRFTNTSPEDMLLTASPQSMPSADVPNAGGAEILAKVMDENGNGVPGEVVHFSWVQPGTWAETHVKDPILDSESARTDDDGIATVHFTPGAFSCSSDDNYNPTASESCTVVAWWGSRTRSIDLEWKNYPYLRVETDVDPETVEVGDPVDVTIRLIGDGWALYPEPIDVMLCVDRSSSMLFNNPDRMVSAMSALRVFNGEMEEGRDRVGMTSFGVKGTADITTYYRKYAGADDTYDDDLDYIKDFYDGNPGYYSDYATLDLNLTLDRSAVNRTINDLVPMKGTPMRGGLYKAIKEIIEKPRADAVRAVIVLSDGDYNWYGDPLARGTGYFSSEHNPEWYTYKENDPDYVKERYYKFTGLSEQNMSVYAASNNITLYSISFGNGLTEWGNSTLDKLATSTGGKHYHAPTGDKLTDIYKDIAGELKTEAGVNTEMNVRFEKIELNNVSQFNSPDDPILEYEHEEGVSTLIKSWNATGSEASPNIRRDETLDQTSDWAANRSLNFDSGDIGTISLGQTWQAVFRLNVSKAGNINIFGDGSAIFFNNGTESLALPKTYITAVDNLNATGINFGGLRVYDLECVEAADGAVIDTYLTMDWNLNYSGIDTVTQCLYYQNVDDGFWTKFCMFDVAGPLGDIPDPSYTKKLYVADFPPGRYKLRVHATADDAPDSVAEILNPITIGMGVKNYILLE